MLHPSAVTSLKINGNPVSQKHRQMVLSFILLYFFVFVIGTVLMTLFGSDIQTSAGAVATTMGGIGPGLGIVGPVSNFASVPDISKVLLSILMLLGRLEIYTVLLIFTRGIWKI
jgi:trk system potassium uptake protein TrkH